MAEQVYDWCSEPVKPGEGAPAAGFGGNREKWLHHECVKLMRPGEYWVASSGTVTGDPTEPSGTFHVVWTETGQISCKAQLGDLFHFQNKSWNRVDGASKCRECKKVAGYR